MSNATLDRDTATGTITDDDRTPVLAVAGGSGNEGDTIEFRVSRRCSTSRSATVEYSTEDGTAQAGTDYEAATGTLTFAVGDESLLVPVRLLNDDVDEPDEALSLLLSNADGATIAVSSAEGTPPTLPRGAVRLAFLAVERSAMRADTSFGPNAGFERLLRSAVVADMSSPSRYASSSRSWFPGSLWLVVL